MISLVFLLQIRTIVSIHELCLFFLHLDMSLKQEKTDYGGPDLSRYRLIRKLTFEEIPDFVFEQIKKVNIVTLTYFVVLFVLLAAVFLYPVFCIRTGYPLQWWIRAGIRGFILFPVLLIPLHEGVHGLFYVFSGARNLKTGFHRKMFFFYVAAHLYPVSKKWFTLIAWAPAVIITVMLVVPVLFMNLPSLTQWSLLVTAFVHFTMCIGDFAMAGFIHSIRDPGVITMDDLSEETAFFYIPEKKMQS